MTTDLLFADFNDRRDEPAPPAAVEESIPIAKVDDIRSKAWTEGYISARQQAGDHSGSPALLARLLTSVHDLGATAAAAVDAASLAVADLLVSTVISVTQESWSAGLLDRVRLVAERIRPALTVAPEFVLRDHHGTEQHFGDISALSCALDAGGGDDVTIRWQHGQATISRTAYLDELRDAIIPLTAGRAHERNLRNET